MGGFRLKRSSREATVGRVSHTALSPLQITQKYIPDCRDTKAVLPPKKLKCCEIPSIKCWVRKGTFVDLLWENLICLRHPAALQMNGSCKVHKHAHKVKTNVSRSSHLETSLECLERMECLFVRAAGSGEKKSKRPFCSTSEAPPPPL